MKRFDATKPKYNHLFRAVAILTNFIDRCRMDSPMMLLVTNLSSHNLMIGIETTKQVGECILFICVRVCF